MLEIRIDVPSFISASAKNWTSAMAVDGASFGSVRIATDRVLVAGLRASKTSLASAPRVRISASSSAWSAAGPSNSSYAEA